MVPMKQITILMVVGSIIILLCSIFLGTFPLIFSSIVNKMLVLSEDSATLDDFISPPVPVYMQFYFFNVSNPNEIKFHGDTPNVTQVGPYTYEEVRTKHNMTWNGTDGTVTYLQDKSFFFREELSGGLKESDEITTVNAVMVKNNTDDKTYKVKTGEKGLDEYLNIVEWDGSPTLSYWNDTYCDMINGTDGTQYPPKVTKDRVLYLYTSELCRSLYLTFEKERDFLGIPTMKFIPPKDVLEDPMVNLDNQCYCIPDSDHCLGASMLNMAPCAFDAPVILSTPHFYQGNIEDIKSINGLDPRKDEHETYLDIEPNTGVAMRAMKKMQINVPLRRYGSLPSFKNVPEVIFPIVWVNESAQLDEAMAKDVKKAIILPFTIIDAICGTLIGIGAILLFVGAYKFVRLRRSRNQQKI